jgi:hypothetical protein
MDVYFKLCVSWGGMKEGDEKIKVYGGNDGTTILQ